MAHATTRPKQDPVWQRGCDWVFRHKWTIVSVGLLAAEVAAVLAADRDKNYNIPVVDEHQGYKEVGRLNLRNGKYRPN